MWYSNSIETTTTAATTAYIVILGSDTEQLNGQQPILTLAIIFLYSPTVSN